MHQQDRLVGTRRDALKMGAQALILASIGGSLVQCSPPEAAEQGAEFRTLTAQEGTLLAAFAEAIVPGAQRAGCAHFVDHHISVMARDSLLTLRYLDVKPPYAQFYRSGLAALHNLAGGQPSPERWNEIIEALLASTVSPWAGPPPALFYFAVRSDAVDLVYGTRAGFERLGVDYMPHILPERDW